MKIDKNIIVSLSQGDYKAFEKVFYAFYPKTHCFAMMLLKNKDDADDICQLIFMKLWQHRERLIEVSDIDAYLFMLGKNTILDYISTHQLSTTPIDNIHDHQDEITPHQQVVANDTQLLIDMVVKKMPHQRQTIYRMSREQHKKNEDIANILGLTKKTVENHLNLALKDIKNALHLAILAISFWV